MTGHRLARSLAAAGGLAVFGIVGCTDDTTTAPPGADPSSSLVVDNTPPTNDLPATTAGPSATTVPPPPTGDLAGVSLRLTPVAEIDNPIALTWRVGDDRLYLADWEGTVWTIGGEGRSAEPVLDISGLTREGGERGLLGIAFAPDGTHFYASYTDNDGDSNIDEFAVAGDGAIDAGSRRRVLFVDQPYSNHNGGHIAFGPDGYFYIGLGDGGSGGDPAQRAQNPGELLGKLLRIDPRPSGDFAYTIPADNPFVGQADVRPEIWALGLRNPWRWSFDRATDDLWIADVGQNQIEEVDVSPAASGAGRAANYGWDAYEGSEEYEGGLARDGLTFPVFEYGHGEGCSVTGGYVYRGDAIPGLRGVYVFADVCNTWIRGITQDGGTRTGERILDIEQGQIVSFGEGPDGELYVLSFDGVVLRIDPA